MSVPLATFAEQYLGSCYIWITDVAPTNNEANNQIVLGGMFSQEFYTSFVNNYTALVNGGDISQTAEIYISHESLYMPYIFKGYYYLPEGVNPFNQPVPPSPSPSNKGISVWAIVFITFFVIVVILLLGGCVYKRDKVASCCCPQ